MMPSSSRRFFHSSKSAFAKASSIRVTNGTAFFLRSRVSAKRGSSARDSSSNARSIFGQSESPGREFKNSQKPSRVS